MHQHQFKLSHSLHCCDHEYTTILTVGILTPPASRCSDNTQNLHRSTSEWKQGESPHPRAKVERNPRQSSKVKGQCAVSILIIANMVSIIYVITTAQLTADLIMWLTVNLLQNASSSTGTGCASDTNLDEHNLSTHRWWARLRICESREFTILPPWWKP